MLLSLGLCWVTFRYLDIVWLPLALALFVVLFLVFRDPRRRIPAVALGVVSPVDGSVVTIDEVTSGVHEGKAQCVVVRINSFGTYTARSPVEGKVMDLNSLPAERTANHPTNALWMQTDEGDDVVLYFRGYRFGLAPRSLMRYGERLGQGTRCAYLRLTRFAEMHLPMDAKVQVTPGQKVVAGQDVLAKLHSD